MSGYTIFWDGTRQSESGTRYLLTEEEQPRDRPPLVERVRVVQDVEQRLVREATNRNPSTRWRRVSPDEVE